MSNELNSCCGCIGLRKGSFIIGYFQLVQLILSIIFTIVFAVIFGEQFRALAGTPDHYDKAYMMVYSILVVAVIIAIASWSVMLIFTIILLVGLHKRKPGLLTAYLVYCVVFYFLYLIGFVLGLSRGFMGFTSFLVNLLNLILSLYFMLVIKSYQDVMKNDLVKPVYGANF